MYIHTYIALGPLSNPVLKREWERIGLRSRIDYSRTCRAGAIDGFEGWFFSTECVASDRGRLWMEKASWNGFAVVHHLKRTPEQVLRPLDPAMYVGRRIGHVLQRPS